MNSLFITGASGFVGRALLKRLDRRKYKSVYCLSRSESQVAATLPEHPNVTFIRGTLFDSSRYEPSLALSDSVIHLAAVTGKARPEEYFRVNVEGTRLLVEHCRRAGVARFLYVSSIAVKFPDKTRYYYAQSKQQAEEVVRNSGLRYVIIRPTIVVGRGAPALKGLSKLAHLPVMPVFGHGKTLVQPIAVDDLVDFIFSIIDADRFSCETFDLGGPEVICIEEFLKKIRRLRSPANFRTVHIPLALLIPILSTLETLFSSFLPVTVGQLSSFRYDGTIERNRLFEERLPGLKTVDEMLKLACSHDA